MKRVIHWFRRDLRITDNTALSQAAKRAEHVIPVLILDKTDRPEENAGAARLDFRLRSLASLQKNLAELGYPLVVRHGKPEEILPRLCREATVEAVFANKRYEPHEQACDNRVFSALNSAGIGFELSKDTVLWEEQEVLTQASKPFAVFTPYSKAWKKKNGAQLPKEKLRPSRTHHQTLNIRSDALPVAVDDFGLVLTQDPMSAGERAATEALRQFIDGPVYSYAVNRDVPATAGTSQLSPHLCAGTIGIRTIFAALVKARAAATTPAQKQGCDVFLNELIWREFYLQVLHNFPHVARGAFRPEYDGLAWSENQDHFQAWCEGRTGYPIVDAAMRCLNKTGWMHNRLRMIVAMFLTKDLLIHWQSGERYFMKQLVDGDLAANNGGWQWSAGTGTDAAPYFRIFNPVSQGAKFDPQGEFVRRWVPEVASLPTDVVHQPWKSPLTISPTSYPRRIVLHEQQRPRCLALYQTVQRRPTRTA